METKMAYGNPKLNRDVIKYIAMLTRDRFKFCVNVKN